MTLEERRQVLGALAGDKKIIKSLPDDSPLVRHLPQAEAALKAYCQGDDKAVEQALGKIPFRSPYRDLRFLLKALLCFPDDPDAGKTSLDRIGADSPFAGPARVVRVLFGGDRKALKPVAREFVRAIAGRGGEKAQPKQIFSTLLGEAKKDPAVPGLQTALTALLVYYPAGRSAYLKVYGALPPGELGRFEALAAEKAGDLETALNNWGGMALFYESEGKPRHSALVLRHMVELLDKDEFRDGEEMVSLLRKSLMLDPEDRDSWRRLADLYHEFEDERSRGRVLEDALARFPDDPALLEVAAEAAIDRGAFKKAARLTMRLLEIDPINRRARQRLLNAHLRHARKQIKGRKFDLAAREIEQAREWAREPEEKSRVEVMAELIAFLRGEILETTFQQAQTQLPSPLLDCLIAAEVLHLDFPPRQTKPYLKRLRQVLDHQAMHIDKATVTALIDLLVQSSSEEVPIEELLKPMRSFLKKGAKLDWSEEELVVICEKLLSLGQYQLIRDYVRASPLWKRKPGQPSERPPPLVYFDVIAKCKGEAAALEYLDLGAMEKALELARQTRQHRFAGRILGFLQEYENSRFFVPSFHDMEDLDDFDDLGDIDDVDPLKMVEEVSRRTGIPVAKLLDMIFGGGKK